MVPCPRTRDEQQAERLLLRRPIRALPAHHPAVGNQPCRPWRAAACLGEETEREISALV